MMRSEQATSERVRVLLVEDSDPDARLAREMLADADRALEVTRVRTLAGALERIADRSFDAVLLDLSLPDAHGLAGVARLQHEAPGVPIVVLSGHRSEALALKAVQSGAQDYLVKGWGNGPMLARALRYAIERKRAERRLAWLAHHDTLTELPNRTLLHERLNRALARARDVRRPVVLMLLDLDGFKQVNDRYGHGAGDALLRTVGRRLLACMRSRDTVARLGGDEFAMVLEDLGRSDAAVVAEKVVAAIAEPVVVEGLVLEVGASVGGVVFPEGGNEPSVLLERADAALYAAKSAGRGSCRFYELPA